MIEHRSDCPAAQGGHECTCLELTPVQPARVNWQIPRNVWYLLLTWGLSVVVLAFLFAWWQGREAAVERRHNHEQDKALCEVIVFSLQAPPTIPPGPEGERIREGLAKAERLREVTCDEEAPG